MNLKPRIPFISRNLHPYFISLFAVLPLLISPGCPPPKFPEITFDPPSLAFSPQLIDPSGSSNNSQTVTITSSGTGTLNISSIAASGLFNQSNNCPATMPSHTSCTMQVTFAPNAVGPASGAVTITSNAFNKAAAVISLSGTGVPPISFQPSNLDFGSIAVGSSSSTQSVTLANNLATTLTITGIGISGGYSQTNNCTTVSAGQSCQINVKFSPTLGGIIAGGLSVTSDATPDAQPLGLTGTGVGTVTSGISLSPASLNFGSREAGSISSEKTAGLKNVGSTLLSIAAVHVSSGYVTSTDTCSGASITPGKTCAIGVKFNPAANLVTVDYPGAVTIVDSDPSTAQTIGLTGTAVPPISAVPLALDFGTVFVDSRGVLLDPAPTQKLTLTNNDNSGDGVSVASSGHYDLSHNTCPQTLASGANCSTDVTFTSAYTSGTNLGAVNVTSSNGGFLSPTTVNLSACATAISLQPPSFNFGTGTQGVSSEPGIFTVTNGSGKDLDISNVSLTGTNSGDFAISSNDCTSPLTAGNSCTLNVIDTPAGVGSRSAALTMADDGDCNPQQAALQSGSGTGPFTVYLSVNEVTASGEILSTPAGIDCSSGTCFGKFPGGTKVTLDGSPAGAFQIAWSGSCSGTSSCSLTMDSDKQVTASLTRNPELTVTLTGTGGGTVSSVPGGINCSSPVTSDTTCVADFAAGASITLTAKAAADSRFDGWSGACMGTGTCTFVSSSDQTIGAKFTSTAPDYILSSPILSPATVPPGKNASSSVAVASVNGFNNAVTLSCAVTPSMNLDPTCTISPASVTPSANGSTTAILTVSTTAPSAAGKGQQSRSLFFGFWILISGTALLAGPRATEPRRRRVAWVVTIGALLFAVALESACGNGSSIKPPPRGGTPAGVYTITVTGTAGNVSHSASTTLTVE